MQMEPSTHFASHDHVLNYVLLASGEGDLRCCTGQPCSRQYSAAHKGQCTCRLEAVLIQNHFFDVWHDDLGNLAEEDAAASSSNSANLSELQSFTDMAYTQGRCVSALQWVPGQKVSDCLMDNICYLAVIMMHNAKLQAPWMQV